MIELARADVRRIFGKAEESDIPERVALGTFDFYHWRSPAHPKLYLVYEQAKNITGIAFDVTNYDRLVSVQCELCFTFRPMTDIIHIRSQARIPPYGVAYRAVYSYVCRDTDVCHSRVYRATGLRRLLTNHADAVEVVGLVV